MSSCRSFDPRSRGAVRLARDWLAHRDRWRVRVVGGFFVESDGQVVVGGETMEVSATHGRALVDEGRAEFVSRRLISARD